MVQKTIVFLFDKCDTKKKENQPTKLNYEYYFYPINQDFKKDI